MIVIGMLLILIAAGALAFVLMAPAALSEAIELTAIGVSVNATPLALFVAGALSLALLGLGFAMIGGGARRKAKARKELHQLRKEQTAAPSTPAAAGEAASRRDRPQQGRSPGTGTDSESTSPR
jgi:hypothetical protein